MTVGFIGEAVARLDLQEIPEDLAVPEPALVIPEGTLREDDQIRVTASGVLHPEDTAVIIGT